MLAIYYHTKINCEDKMLAYFVAVSGLTLLGVSLYFFFLSLYAFLPKGALGYDSTYCRHYAHSLYNTTDVMSFPISVSRSQSVMTAVLCSCKPLFFQGIARMPQHTTSSTIMYATSVCIGRSLILYYMNNELASGSTLKCATRLPSNIHSV